MRRLAELYEDRALNESVWRRVAEAFRERYGIRGRLDEELHASMLVWSVNTVSGRLAYAAALVDALDELRRPPDDPYSFGG